MNADTLLIKLLHVANQAQDQGNDGTDIVRIPDHAALTLDELDYIIEALKDYRHRVIG